MSQDGQVRRATYADQVAELILTLIQDAHLAPGADLPSEGDLAARFGVNRLAVREAIRSLVAQELLVTSQGKPARVAAPSGRVLGRILSVRLNQRSVTFDDVLDTRVVLETHLTRTAAERVRAGATLDPAAAEHLEGMRASVTDEEAFIVADIAFHRAVTDFGGNPVLQLFLDSMQEVLMASRRASWEGRQQASGDHRPTLRAHQRILNAVHKGEPEAAETAMRAHLSATITDLAQLNQNTHQGAAARPPGRNTA